MEGRELTTKPAEDVGVIGEATLRRAGCPAAGEVDEVL